MKRYRLFIGLAILIGFVIACTQDLPIIMKDGKMDIAGQQKRVDYSKETLKFDQFTGFKGDPGEYTFTVVATVDPPEVDGEPVQACYVYTADSKIYVAYNDYTQRCRGALDVFEYTLDGVSTELTAVGSIGFPHSDINCVTRIPDEGDGFEIFLVGASIGHSAQGVTTPAFLNFWSADLSAQGVVNLNGYAANSINYEDGSDQFTITTGSNGGLYVFDRSTITQSVYLEKANMTSVYSSEGIAYQICSEPSSLDLYTLADGTTDQLLLTGYGSDPVSKSSVEVAYGHSFIALNDGGIVIVRNSDKTIVETISPANYGGVDPQFLVTNGLCVGGYLLYAANGGGGLTVSELDTDMNATPIGNVEIHSSVNHVSIIETNGSDGYLAVANGTGGLQIIHFTYSGEEDTFTDARDGHEYKYVTIGDQIWMAENLAYLPKVSPSADGSETDTYYYVYGYEGATVSEAKATDNYSTYGVLYNWKAAVTSCPDGWHISSDEEWKELEMFLGMNQTDANSEGWRDSGDVGAKLKSITGWNINVGTDDVAFSALPGGHQEPGGGWRNLGVHAYFWGSESSQTRAWYRNLDTDNINLSRDLNDKDYGFSVRCIKGAVLPTLRTAEASAITHESATSGGNISSDGGSAVTARGVCWSTNSNPTTANSKTTDGTGPGSFTSSITGLTAGTPYYVRAYATNNVGTSYGNELSFTSESGWTCGDPFTDARDGNVYETVAIGGQCWMAKNLAYLPSVSPSADGSDTDPYNYVYSYEGTDVLTAKATTNYSTYGVLYNWPAALNGSSSGGIVQGICPNGWHLPSDVEWTTLTDFLGSLAGGKMKEEGTSHWISTNIAATNESGFTALPGGNRYNYGGFSNLGYFANFWSSSSSGSYAWFRYLSYYSDGVGRYNSRRSDGLSVRCLQN